MGEGSVGVASPLGGWDSGANWLTYLLHLGTVLRGGEGGRVTLLLQVHLHELVDGELTGGRVLELCQPDGRWDEMSAVLTLLIGLPIS